MVRLYLIACIVVFLAFICALFTSDIALICCQAFMLIASLLFLFYYIRHPSSDGS